MKYTTNFVMYVPGSKGKFVAELCDIITNTEIYQKHTGIIQGTGPDNITHAHAYGYPVWIDQIKIHEYFNEVHWPEYSGGHVMGFDPEDQLGTKWIDAIEGCVTWAHNKKYIDQNFTPNIDTHYFMHQTMMEILSRKHKVIAIQSLQSNIGNLVNNFLYKHFVESLNLPSEKIEYAGNLLATCRFSKIGDTVPEDKQAIINRYKNIPYQEWPMECWDLIRTSMEIVASNTIVSSDILKIININDPRFLLLRYNELKNINVLERIAKHLGVDHVPELAVKRFNGFNNKQGFEKFEDVIEMIRTNNA